MSDLISRQDAIEAVEQAIFNHDSAIMRITELPSADRPTGEVDAVAIYEKAEHDLEHGRITLGEFEKRIEPLKHLYYDRPTGEWIEVEEYDGICYQCSNCKEEYILIDGTPKDNGYNYCPNCRAKMGGGE